MPLRDELEWTSFTPLLSYADRPWKKAVFSQFLRDGIWIAPDKVPNIGRCVRTERYRYVEWTKKDSTQVVAKELYDLKNDPLKNENIAEDQTKVKTIAELALLLKQGWKQALPQ